MKKLLGFIFFTITVSIVTAQQPRQFELSTKDSLEKLLAASQPDTNRVMIFSVLAIRSLRSSLDTAMMYAQKGLALARALKFRKGEADCLRRSGIVLFQEGRTPEALDIYLKALSISENINHPFGISAGLGHIGDVYTEQGDYSKARSYYFRQLKIGEATYNEDEQARALLRLGRSFLQQEYLDSASIFFNRALKVANNRESFGLGDIWANVGKLQAKMGNEAEAMTFFRKSISTATTANSFNILSDAYTGIADLFRKAGQLDSCIFYAGRALTSGQQNNYAQGILAASELLSKVYGPVDEHESFKYHKIATAIKDSLFNTEKTNQVQNLFFVEQQRQQTLEAARTKYKNQLKLYALLTALSVFLLLAILLWRNNRHRRRAYVLLQNQKLEIDLQKQMVEQTLEELKATQAQLIQSEKMASLGELTAGIAHEIQNPLNFVNNFSDISNELLEEMKNEIQKGNKEDAMTIAVDIKQNLEKILQHGKRADAIVKGMMQHSRTGSGQKEPTNINTLVDEYLRLAYHGLRAKDKTFNAKLETDFDSNIDKINIVPQEIGRAILNLINNAFYAVSEKKKKTVDNYEPTILVSTKKLNRKVEIRVKDNGNGIPQKVLDKIFQPFFTTKPTGEGTGLGLSLAYDIVKAHGGEIKVETKEDIGSQFVIQLPVT